MDAACCAASQKAATKASLFRRCRFQDWRQPRDFTFQERFTIPPELFMDRALVSFVIVVLATGTLPNQIEGELSPNHAIRKAAGSAKKRYFYLAALACACSRGFTNSIATPFSR